MKAKLIVTLDDGKSVEKEFSMEDSEAFETDPLTGERICQLFFEVKIEEAAWLDMMIHRLKNKDYKAIEIYGET